MIVKENQLYKTAMKFASSFSEYPEAVIYAYSKLLTMGERQIRYIVSADCMDDLEIARKWFSDNKLDLELIKSGLLTVIPKIPAEESKIRRTDFNFFMEYEMPKVTSWEILQKACGCSYVPVKTIFAQGNELEDIFKYLATIKKTYAPKEKESSSSKEQGESSVALSDEEMALKDRRHMETEIMRITTLLPSNNTN